VVQHLAHRHRAALLAFLDLAEAIPLPRRIPCGKRRCKQLGNSAHHFTPALTCSHFPPPHPSEPPRHTKSPEPVYSPTGGPR